MEGAVIHIKETHVNFLRNNPMYLRVGMVVGPAASTVATHWAHEATPT